MNYEQGGVNESPLPPAEPSSSSPCSLLLSHYPPTTIPSALLILAVRSRVRIIISGSVSILKWNLYSPSLGQSWCDNKGEKKKTPSCLMRKCHALFLRIPTIQPGDISRHCFRLSPNLWVHYTSPHLFSTTLVANCISFWVYRYHS